VVVLILVATQPCYNRKQAVRVVALETVLLAQLVLQDKAMQVAVRLVIQAAAVAQVQQVRLREILTMQPQVVLVHLLILHGVLQQQLVKMFRAQFITQQVVRQVQIQALAAHALQLEHLVVAVQAAATPTLTDLQTQVVEQAATVSAGSLAVQAVRELSL
jgi:hypothetical protein